MTSKAEYLKKYLSKEDGGSDKKKKKKLKVKKRSNLAILDDDVDWKALVPKHGDLEAEEDPDDAPIVTEIHDERAERLHPKWQPVNTKKEDDNDSGNGGRGFQAVGSPDLSPPRRLERRRHDSSDPSPPRKTGKRGGSPDLSPPRKPRRRGDSPDQSPPRRSRWKEETPDQSPPRRSRWKEETPDQSPPRKSRRKEESPDLSPPRRARRSSPDLSPPRKARTIHSPDLSPPRREQKRCMSHSLSHLNPPSRKKISSRSSPLKALETQRHDSPDLSPPRLRRRHDSGSDLSPPRRHDSPDSDLSPPRKSRKNDSDLSPPRGGISDSRSSGWNGEKDTYKSIDRKQSKKATKMASGATAGLQTAEVLREENAQVRERQETFYKTLDPTLSGRHAETVYRDKEGRRIDPKMERARKREEERQKDEEDEQFMEWGRGVAQTKQAHERISDELYEMSKPLARYADDEDLEKMLREREREGDPMLAFLRSKRGTEPIKEGRPKKEKPSYKGSFPPNRFGIRPGYRWDGVNRSNGFEKAWFSREANKMATSEQAYKWSVEDM